jgi:hypothetical protein
MLERKQEIQRKIGKIRNLPQSRGSSLVGHRSLRSSAGASLALPAWLRLLGGASLCSFCNRCPSVGYESMKLLL